MTDAYTEDQIMISTDIGIRIADVENLICSNIEGIVKCKIIPTEPYLVDLKIKCFEILSRYKIKCIKKSIRNLFLNRLITFKLRNIYIVNIIND